MKNYALLNNSMNDSRIKSSPERAQSNPRPRMKFQLNHKKNASMISSELPREKAILMPKRLEEELRNTKNKHDISKEYIVPNCKPLAEIQEYYRKGQLKQAERGSPQSGAGKHLVVMTQGKIQEKFNFIKNTYGRPLLTNMKAKRSRAEEDLPAIYHEGAASHKNNLLKMLQKNPDHQRKENSYLGPKNNNSSFQKESSHHYNNKSVVYETEKTLNSSSNIPKKFVIKSKQTQSILNKSSSAHTKEKSLSLERSNGNINNQTKSSSKRNLSNNINDSLNNSTALDRSKIKRTSNRQVAEPADHASSKPQNSMKNEKAVQAFEKGKELMKKNQYEEAIGHFQTAISLEPLFSDSMYLLGACYANLGNYKKAIEELSFVIKNLNYENKNAYLLLAYSYKRQGLEENSLRIFSKAVGLFPSCEEAWLGRGKLRINNKSYEEALGDFNRVLEINKKNFKAYLFKGDCLRLLRRYSEALQSYEQVIESQSNVRSQAILQKAGIFLELKNLEECLKTVDEYIALEQTCSEGFYLKGLIHHKKGDISDAQIFFEQAIKFNTSRKAVINSLIDLIKIKIEERDLYSAYHTINRVEGLEVGRTSPIETLSLFVEGAIFMMKRKFEEGIKMLSQISTNIQGVEFLEPLIMKYRAYGYFCQSKYELSLNDFTLIKKLGFECDTSLYNRLLLEGIIQANQQGNFTASFEKFQAAHEKFPMKAEPFLYQSLLYLQFDKNEGISKNKTKAYELLKAAYDINGTNHNICYFKGLLELHKGSLEHALVALTKAIEQSENDNVNYFYARALANAQAGIFDEAYNDVSIALNIDANFENAYLLRSNCLFYMGNLNSSLDDLKKYLLFGPNDEEAPLLLGNFFFSLQAYDDAIKAYSLVSEDLNCHSKAIYLRIKCLIQLKELNQAIEDLNYLIEKGLNAKAVFDRSCLTSLRSASNYFNGEEPLEGYKNAYDVMSNLARGDAEGEIFKLHDFIFYKAVFDFYMESWDLAIEGFMKALESVNASDKEFNESDGFIYENYSFTTFEVFLNITLSFVMKADFARAKERCSNLLKVIPINYSENMQFLLYLILKEINNELRNKDMEAQINDCSSFEVFSSENRLCSIFPEFDLPFTNSKKMQTRLSFCMPRQDLSPRSITFDKLLLKNIKVSSVENKPEAPWIKRMQEGIIFTDNIQIIPNVVLETEPRLSKRSEKDSENNIENKSNEDIINTFINSEKIHKSPRDENPEKKEPVRRNLKDFLKLSPNIEEKLNKILKNK